MWDGDEAYSNTRQFWFTFFGMILHYLITIKKALKFKTTVEDSKAKSNHLLGVRRLTETTGSNLTKTSYEMIIQGSFHPNFLQN